MGGEKQSSNIDRATSETSVDNSATESLGIRAAGGMRLMEDGSSSAAADYVLISRISSATSTDVVGGLNNILNQQGGEFGSYTPRTTSSVADIENFTAANNAAAPATRTDSIDTNATPTTGDANTASAADANKGTQTKGASLTGGDVLTIAIN